MTEKQQQTVGEKRYVVSAVAFKKLSPAKKLKKAICNADIVDDSRSCPITGVASLKPGLVEDRDYYLVSEQMWKALAHEFGSDWEICRFAHNAGKLAELADVVDVYPQAVELFYWNHDMDAPRKVVCQCQGNVHQMVLSFATTAQTGELSLEKLKSICWKFLCDHHLVLFPKQYPSEFAQTLELWWCQDDRDSKWQQLNSVDDWSRHHPQFLCLRESWWNSLAEGDVIDARDTEQNWYEGRVLQASSTHVKIHYRGWTWKWDEWIDRASDRLALLHTKTANWRNLQIGDKVQVGCNVPRKSFPKWREGAVLDGHSVVARSDGRETLWVYVSWDGKCEWREAQDELLCAPGTHRVP